MKELDPWGDVTDTKPAEKKFPKVWVSISFETIGKIFKRVSERLTYTTERKDGKDS